MILSDIAIQYQRQDDQAGNSGDIYTDLSELPQSDEADCEYGSQNQKSPYFAGGRKNTGYKRKRGGSAKAGSGASKLTKKGKWFGKSDSNSKRSSYSANKFSGTASRKSTTTCKTTSSSTSNNYKGLNLLAPPNARTVKKENVK